MRYIDADNILYKDLSEGSGVCWVTFWDWIKEIPTADVRENVMGEWVIVVEKTEMYDKEGEKTWGSLCQCNKCGFVLNAVEGHIGQYNFCPNCGAAMKQI